MRLRITAGSRPVAENPADKHGTHRYTFAATGLDPIVMRKRTEGYEEYFGVQQEPLD